MRCVKPLSHRVQPRTHGPVRVCFFIDELSKAGTESQLVALIERLDRTRVEPTLCLLRGESHQSRLLEPRNCPVLRLGIQSLRSPSTPLRLWRLAQHLRTTRTDVLQTYFPESTYLGVPLGRLARVPCVLRARNNLGYWMTPGHRLLSRWCARLADGLVTNSGAGGQAAVESDGIDPNRVVVLENGVDLKRFPPLSLQRTRRLGEPLRVGVIANLRPVKGLDVFLRAAAHICAIRNDVIFSVAGEGPQRSELETLRQQLRLEGRLFLPGSCEDIVPFLSSLDVVVLPSRSEGMSNALLEAMAAGKAIVATSVGGTAQLIQDGVEGLLVPPGEDLPLAAAILRLLDEGELAQRFGAAARHKVETRYERAVMVRRFEDFYEALILRRAT